MATMVEDVVPSASPDTVVRGICVDNSCNRTTVSPVRSTLSSIPRLPEGASQWTLSGGWTPTVAASSAALASPALAELRCGPCRPSTVQMQHGSFGQFSVQLRRQPRGSRECSRRECRSSAFRRRRLGRGIARVRLRRPSGTLEPARRQLLRAPHGLSNVERSRRRRRASFARGLWSLTCALTSSCDGTRVCAQRQGELRVPLFSTRFRRLRGRSSRRPFRPTRAAALGHYGSIRRSLLSGARAAVKSVSFALGRPTQGTRQACGRGWRRRSAGSWARSRVASSGVGPLLWLERECGGAQEAVDG